MTVTEVERGPLDRVPSSVMLAGGAVLTVVLFLFAVQLLGATTRAATPTLRPVLTRLLVGDASALGLGWLAAYALANGSVVAALSLSLFDAGLVPPAQLFLLVAGSRLGGAAVVVFVGALDYLGRRDGGGSLRRHTALGLLTFLVTLSVYLPVTAVGYAARPFVAGDLAALGRSLTRDLPTLAVFDPATAAVIAAVGPGPAFALAVAVLFGTLRLFDRVLDRADAESLRDRLFSRFQRTWLSFAAGVLVTTLTTSVAFSLGVVVPLYNRGYVERDELLPYVLGANLGTLSDTLVVAAVLDSPVGVGSVLFLVGLATAATLAALAVAERYAAAVATAHDRLLDDRRAFLAFVAALVAGPLALVAVPLALG